MSVLHASITLSVTKGLSNQNQVKLTFKFWQTRHSERACLSFCCHIWFNASEKCTVTDLIHHGSVENMQSVWNINASNLPQLIHPHIVRCCFMKISYIYLQALWNVLTDYGLTFILMPLHGLHVKTGLLLTGLLISFCWIFMPVSLIFHQKAELIFGAHPGCLCLKNIYQGWYWSWIFKTLCIWLK